MRILFLQSITYPFIGIMSISTVLGKSGLHTKVHILNLNRPSPADFKTIHDYQPDVVAFPTYTGWQNGIIKFCRIIKDKMNVITVLGGAHPTHCPEIVQSDVVDFICVGEG
ncbi:MAG: cobalamin-dependent protein, partial [bacterium]